MSLSMIEEVHKNGRVDYYWGTSVWEGKIDKTYNLSEMKYSDTKMRTLEVWWGQHLEGYLPRWWRII